MLSRPSSLLIIGFVAIIVATPSLASNITSSPSLYNEAVQSYKDKKYSQSLSQFKKMHDRGLCNDMVHYYMALCYQCQSQVAAAKAEYSNVARSKSPNLRQNALYALASLDQWSQHRSYQGNGNVFQRYGTGGSSGRSFAPPRSISIDVPISTGGGC